jgi:hypothetical protein
MKSLSKIRLAIFLALLASCGKPTNKNIDDPEVFASKYCNCMTDNGGEKNFQKALNACDSALIKENRLFRIFRTQLTYYDASISAKTRDSVLKYMRVVDSCTRENCCKVTANYHETRQN